MTTVILSGPVTVPALYRIGEAEYHADPCPEPSLSRSIAKVLLDQSAAHAKSAHPRMTPPDPEVEEKNARKVDMGSAAHALLLNQPVEIFEIKDKTYQTKAAKAERLEAYERGAVPLLTADYNDVTAMIARAKADLGQSDERVIRDIMEPIDGISTWNEITGCWQDKVGGVWCRARMDRFAIDEEIKRVTVIDYKTTEMSAAPFAVAKAIYDNAYDLQDGFYRRGIRQLIPQIDSGEYRLDFLFIVQEQNAPFEITVARLDDGGRIIGEKKASAAVRLWAECVKTNTWPGYPRTTVIAEMPPYVDTRWCQKEIEDPRINTLSSDDFGPYEKTPYRPREFVGPW